MLPLTMLGHPLPEVLCIESQAVEKETRDYFGPALRALVPPDPQSGLSSARWATLKHDHGIQHLATGKATASSFSFHDQGSLAIWAPAIREHHGIEKLPRPRSEPADRFH
jgi:hypothetical protein